MSHRTQDLPPVSGWRRVLRDIRYHEASRQLLAILLVIVFSVLGKPVASFFFPAVPLVALGIAVRMWASGHIVKNRELATCGPYARVRHPLYTGNILILAGFCLASGLWWSAVVSVVLLLVFYPAAIRYEDSKLERIFDEPWRQWSAATPALIPAIKAYPSEQTGQWSLRTSLRRNGEPIIVLFLAGMLYLLYSKL